MEVGEVPPDHQTRPLHPNSPPHPKGPIEALDALKDALGRVAQLLLLGVGGSGRSRRSGSLVGRMEVIAVRNNKTEKNCWSNSQTRPTCLGLPVVGLPPYRQTRMAPPPLAFSQQSDMAVPSSGRVWDIGPVSRIQRRPRGGGGRRRLGMRVEIRRGRPLELCRLSHSIQANHDVAGNQFGSSSTKTIDRFRIPGSQLDVGCLGCTGFHYKFNPMDPPPSQVLRPGTEPISFHTRAHSAGSVCGSG